MGVADVTSKVLLEFKADTRQARKELKKLSGAQKKSAQAAIKAQEKQNEKLKKGIATLGKAALAVGTVVVAYKALSRSVDFFAKRQQLAAASAGANIGRIQKAANGLITEQEALQFAGAAMNTEFKLSQKEMENVARFMIVLRNQGNDLADVQTRLTQAIVEGNSRALRPFGVIVDGSTGKLKTQQAILKEITKQNKTYAGSLDLAGDAAARLAIRTTDAFDSLKASIGEATNAVIEFVGSLGDNILGPEGSVEQFIQNKARIARLRAQKTKGDDLSFLGGTPLGGIVGLASRQAGAAGIAGAGEFAVDVQKEIRKLEAENAEILKFALINQNKDLLDAVFGEEFGPQPAPARAPGRRGRGGRRGGRGQRGGGLVETPGVIFPTTGGQIGAGFGGGLGGDAGGGLAGVGDPFIDGLPEVPEKIKAVRTEIEALGDVVMTVGDNFTSAFEQWGAGAESFGVAMKKALGGAIADVLMGEAKAHVARAAASAITLNFGKAGLHLAAAAALAAGAGGVRQLLGASGGGASAGGGGGRSPGASAGGFGGGSQRSEVIVLGTNPLEDNPRAARRRVARLVERASVEQGGGTTIVNA